MTGRYSIRSGLSLVAVAGSDISLPATEITIAEMLREAGYATAMFGKWHLGSQPYSQPQNKGFDEFYGIPPGDTWDAFLMIPQGRQTKSLEIPLDKGPQIVEAKRGEPLKTVMPYTAEVRREIDWELVDLARIANGKVPEDRPIDGVDQTDLLLGTSDTGRRDALLTFVGPDLVAMRWKQFRTYFADVAPGRSGWGGANLLPGTGSNAAPMNGYPKVFNIESDPREEHNIGAQYEWIIGPTLKIVEEYRASLRKYPNPPAANITRF